MKIYCISFLLLTVPVGIVRAQHSSHGTLRVSAQVQGSISVVFTADSGPAATFTGTNSAGFTIPVTGGSFTHKSLATDPNDASFLIVSPFQIRVVKANVLSLTYTLSAGLAERDPKHIWVIDGSDISDGAMHAIASAEAYDTGRLHALRVSGSGPQTQPLLNAITFQVIVN